MSAMAKQIVCPMMTVMSAIVMVNIRLFPFWPSSYHIQAQIVHNVRTLMPYKFLKFFAHSNGDKQIHFGSVLGIFMQFCMFISLSGENHVSGCSSYTFLSYLLKKFDKNQTFLNKAKSFHYL